MAGLLYYAPGLSGTIELPKVQEIGLGHAFERNPFCREVKSNTPDGGNGLLLIDRTRLKKWVPGDKPDAPDQAVDLSPSMNIDPEVQYWEQLPSPTDQPLYGGYYVDEKPMPTDLIRSEYLRGGEIRMGDDNLWELPLVRRFDEATEEPISALPSNYRLSSEGKLTPDKTLPRWKWLWEATEDAWNAMVNEQDVTDDAMLETAGKIFTANYAVSPMELSLLRVFADGVMPATIVAICLDYVTWSRWSEAKKKEASQAVTAGSNTAAGETEESAPTSPPVLTS